jgi:hypothetical protein
MVFLLNTSSWSILNYSSSNKMSFGMDFLAHSNNILISGTSSDNKMYSVSFPINSLSISQGKAASVGNNQNIMTVSCSKDGSYIALSYSNGTKKKVNFQIVNITFSGGGSLTIN